MKVEFVRRARSCSAVVYACSTQKHLDEQGYSGVVNRAVCVRRSTARRQQARDPPAVARPLLPRTMNAMNARRLGGNGPHQHFYCRIISNPRSFDFCTKRKPLRDVVSINFISE